MYYLRCMLCAPPADGLMVLMSRFAACFALYSVEESMAVHACTQRPMRQFIGPDSTIFASEAAL